LTSAEREISIIFNQQEEQLHVTEVQDIADKFNAHDVCKPDAVPEDIKTSDENKAQKTEKSNGTVDDEHLNTADLITFQDQVTTLLDQDTKEEHSKAQDTQNITQGNLDQIATNEAIAEPNVTVVTPIIVENDCSNTSVKSETNKGAFVESEIKKNTSIEAEIKQDVSIEAETKQDVSIEVEIKKDVSIETVTKTGAAIETDIKEDTSTEAEIKKDTSTEAEIKKDTSIETKIKNDTSIETEIKKNTSIETEIKKDTLIVTEIKENALIETEIKTNTSFETEIKENASIATEIKEDALITTEIKKDTLIETEIKKDTLIETEIKNDTLIETEIKNDTLIATEIKEDALIEPEIKKDTLLETEIKKDTLLENEIKKDTSMETEIKKDASDETEIKKDTVIETKIEKDASIETGIKQEASIEIKEDTSADSKKDASDETKDKKDPTIDTDIPAAKEQEVSDDCAASSAVNATEPADATITAEVNKKVIATEEKKEATNANIEANDSRDQVQTDDKTEQSSVSNTADKDEKNTADKNEKNAVDIVEPTKITIKSVEADIKDKYVEKNNEKNTKPSVQKPDQASPTIAVEETTMYVEDFTVSNIEIINKEENSVVDEAVVSVKELHTIEINSKVAHNTIKTVEKDNTDEELQQESICQVTNTIGSETSVTQETNSTPVVSLHVDVPVSVVDELVNVDLVETAPEKKEDSLTEQSTPKQDKAADTIIENKIAVKEKTRLDTKENEHNNENDAQDKTSKQEVPKLEVSDPVRVPESVHTVTSNEESEESVTDDSGIKTEEHEDHVKTEDSVASTTPVDSLSSSSMISEEQESINGTQGSEDNKENVSSCTPIRLFHNTNEIE
jgi:pilus assembly protein FimV